MLFPKRQSRSCHESRACIALRASAEYSRNVANSALTGFPLELFENVCFRNSELLGARNQGEREEPSNELFR